MCWRLAALLLALLALSGAPERARAAFASGSYERSGRAGARELVPLVVGLRPRDFAGLERRLWRVSDPACVALGLGGKALLASLG